MGTSVKSTLSVILMSVLCLSWRERERERTQKVVH